VSVRLVTARQVAERLGVNVETVLRWTRRGELPAIRLPGGALRYDEDELDAWLERRSTKADTADRGLSDTRANRARRDGLYVEPLPFSASDTRPHQAATIEEDS
jgi:excisionase family DNA binding protein